MQKDGSWNNPHSAISLGNGHLTGTNFHGNQVGTSTQAQVDFINSVKSAYTARGTQTININGVEHTVNGVDTPFSAQIEIKNQAKQDTNNKDSWDHVKNWWYRDGQLFALILDDRANEMMHGDIAVNQHKDVIISTNDDADTYSYQVTPNEHHMEHLRQFCNRMGGDLWAPSSQQEYADLMERKGGVCEAHGKSLRQGSEENTDTTSQAHWGSTEIYLNIHREDYSECPDTQDKAFVQKDYNYKDRKGGNDVVGSLPCNGKYDPNNAANVADTRRVYQVSPNKFYTTDSYFANNLSSGMCANAVTNREYEYAVYSTINCDNADKPDGDVPYIREECFDAANSKHRFQKFVGTDDGSLNDVLASTKGQQQRQKECVVTTCSEGAVNQGPAGDKRWSSEWNMIGCNQHTHTGICRIRAFGCDDATYTCKENYTRSCGSRSVYSKDVNQYVNAAAQAALTNVINEMKADATIDNKAAKEAVSDVPNLRISSKQEVLVTSDPVADVQTWLTGVAEIPNSIAVETRNAAVTYPQCTCECHVSDYATFNNAAALQQTDAGRNLSIKKPTGAKSDALTTTASYQCSDDLNCYTGSVDARCAMLANGYEAGWGFVTAITPTTCTNTCCQSNPPSFTNAAADVPANWNWLAQKPGAQINVRCTGNNHIGADKTNVQATVTAGSNLDSCWADPGCTPAKCGCPEKENGYCYVKSNPAQSEFTNGDTVICRCNEEFVNTNAVNNLPYDTRTCTNGAWDPIDSVCAPLVCANPPDILEGNTIIAIPEGANWVAGVGERITYKCAEGFENAQAEAPYAECCRKEEALLRTTDDAGQLGFFCPPVGTCRRKYLFYIFLQNMPLYFTASMITFFDPIF